MNSSINIDWNKVSNYWKLDSNGEYVSPVRGQMFFTSLSPCSSHYLLWQKDNHNNVHWPVRNQYGDLVKFDNWDQIMVWMDYIENN